jgi:hypothetical protein
MPGDMHPFLKTASSSLENLAPKVNQTLGRELHPTQDEDKPEWLD